MTNLKEAARTACRDRLGQWTAAEGCLHTADTVWSWEWSPPSRNFYLVYVEHNDLLEEKCKTM